MASELQFLIHDPALSSRAQSPKTPSKPRPVRRRRGPPGHIPRPRNAWIIYRSEILKYSPELSSMSKPQAHISKIVSDKWKAECPEVKEWYYKLAEKEKEEHARLYPGYKYSPNRKPSGPRLDPQSIVVSQKGVETADWSYIPHQAACAPQWEYTTCAPSHPLLNSSSTASPASTCGSPPTYSRSTQMDHFVCTPEPELCMPPAYQPSSPWSVGSGHECCPTIYTTAATSTAVSWEVDLNGMFPPSTQDTGFYNSFVSSANTSPGGLAPAYDYSRRFSDISEIDALEASKNWMSYGFQ